MALPENAAVVPHEHPLVRLSKGLNRVLSWIGMVGAWLSIPLIGVIIFDIVTRRFLVLGSTKLQEMEWHLHSGLFLLTLGFGYLHNAHVRIEVVRERFSQVLKARLEVLGILLFLVPYCALVIYFGIDFAKRSFAIGEISAALTGLSHRWIIKSFVPIGMFLLLLAGMAVLFRNLAYLLLVEKGMHTVARNLCQELPELRDPEEDVRRAAEAEDRQETLRQEQS